MPPPSYGLAAPEFRLPDSTRVGAVRLQVSSLDRSLEYYQQVLGLRLVAQTRESATLGPHGEGAPLVTLETRPGLRPAHRGAFGLYHFALLLPDRAWLGRFAAHLSALDVRVGMADHLVSEALYLWDPDGLGIEVYADRPRSAWQVNGRELAMATDPLDVATVIAAGGGAAWTGMPQGTTMGHVHLHVGDLDIAEAYYHRALGLDKMVWSYPGALFLSAGGYHHHLGTNTWSPGPAPDADRAQLLEWELVVPAADDVAAAGRSLRAGGYTADEGTGGALTADPWGTRVRIRPER
jgi:catechol 2,3-dioxygenase